MGGTAELESDEIFAGRYEVQRLLGEGDRKRTYLARDKKMDRLVAISLVKPEAVLSDPRGTEREAKVLGRIGSHPNIVSLHEHEVDRDGAVEYMIFEYLGGGTLSTYMQTAGQQSLDDILPPEIHPRALGRMIPVPHARFLEQPFIAQPAQGNAAGLVAA